MHRAIVSTVIAALLLSVPAGAQVIRRNPADTVGNAYRIYAPTTPPRAMLVLLPGYGDDTDGYDPSNGYTPSTLPARLAERGVLTMVAVPDPETLYEGDRPLMRLDSMVSDVLQRYRIPRERVAFGGFSAGGTGAVRYAQLCAEGRCRAIPRAAAVFGVDPPLDFERLHRSSELIIRRNAPRSNIAEERMIVETLAGALGGSPDQAREAYARHSPLLASAVDGGNARLLASTPIRLYTEPDVQWWMEQRNLDFHGMNAVDHAAMINLLRVAGNARAELIATTGKGFRRDGRRHPHSWSIVDEPELATWLLGVLVPGG